MKRKQTTTTLPKSINSDLDVWLFFNYLHVVEGLLFHPEEDFSFYTNPNTDMPSYTPKEAEKRNALMEQCFSVCAALGNNIFSVAIAEMNHSIFNIAKKMSDVAECILSSDFVDDNTGEVVSFCPNNFYKIIEEDLMWICVRFSGTENYAIFTRWEFEKHFKQLEEYEVASIKYNL
ncbi:MAG TPA: hypothetical protein DHV28_17305 [Ignavibacteriales bacterium]|nr:hypothetical protein [Ignavibacteriales bacterium]